MGIQRRSCQRHRYPARDALEVQTLNHGYGDLPDDRDGHSLRLTGGTGMLHHATFTIPNYRHGYRTDDKTEVRKRRPADDRFCSTKQQFPDDRFGEA